MLIDSKGWKKISESQLLNKKKVELKQLFDNIYKNKNDFSFLGTDNNKEIFRLLDLAKKKFINIDKILLIGTGGSSLGSKALLSLIKRNRIEFIENIDPSTLKNYLNKNKNKKIGFLIISKSGETIEILSLFNIIKNIFKREINPEKNTIIISDNKKSTLRNIAEKYNIQIFDHDKKIGGRYSCFSITGLLPLHLSGFNAKKLKNIVDESFNDILLHNNYKGYFSISALAGINKKKYIGHVFLVYIDSFFNIGNWYKQLWTESLGKDKKGIHLITALGAVDQHSQLQMWLDGPKNLIFTIVIPKLRKADMQIKDRFKLLPVYLRGKKIGKILNIMAEATAAELQSSGVPVRKIYLEDDQIGSAVKLMTFLMLEVALIGKLLNINPFDQPAVEKVKIRIKKILNKNA